MNGNLGADPILAVGSVAFDSIKNPFGEVERVVGGSALYFSVAASFFTQVRLIAVVGEDFANRAVQVFGGRPIDLGGLQTVPGETFRWKGEYGFDLNTRESIYTKLNVFEQFQPVIPEAQRSTPFVFLGNIQPRLQLDVLDQVVGPRLIAADTMNYWIEGWPDDLREVLKRIHVLFINDEEARQLSNEANLVKAARAIKAMGPRTVVIKRGEHGVLMTCPDEGEFFAAPAMPLEEVFDPTGAGDTFAGGFMGSLAACGAVDRAAMARAIIYGSTLASFAVEDFSLDRLLRLTAGEITERFRRFKHLTHFDEGTALRA
jgi:sugar/nucleoside kinase (ribokinase family)